MERMHIRHLMDLTDKSPFPVNVNDGVKEEIIVCLIKIEAIVREEKMEDVKAALNEIQVNGFTVTQIMGCGTQRGYTEYVRGSKIDVFLKPKIKFEIVVSSEDWEIKVIDAIQKAAFTGDPGDGKIFSYEIRNAVRIRTGETGYDALQSEFL